MKKVIFVFAILISSMTLFAQDAKPKKTPEQRATMYVKELTTELSLTADQSSKIKAVQLESLTKLDTLKAKASAGDKKAGKKADKKEDKEEKGGKKAKPDFLDLDKDGDKKETMKKAAKDAKGGKEEEKGGKGLTAAQKKLPAGLQKAIAAKKK